MAFRGSRDEIQSEFKVRSKSLRAKGGGFDGLKSMESFVAKINEEFITTILIDIEDLYSTSTVGGAIGENSGTNSYITRLSTDVNGVIYKAEMGCIETPAGTNAETDIVLAAISAAPDTGDDVTRGSGYQILVDLAGAWAIGKSMDAGLSTNYGDLNNKYLFLHGGASAVRGGQYTAGKFVIKLYGYNF
tara:strand:+ start:1302 stop:1868 length:567 start_codon:yes stop_codon:yes gene_type:complete